VDGLLNYLQWTSSAAGRSEAAPAEDQQAAGREQRSGGRLGTTSMLSISVKRSAASFTSVEDVALVSEWPKKMLPPLE